MTKLRWEIIVVIVVAACAIRGNHARAASHLWDVSEVFSNADGTIQFIELHCPPGADFETGVNGKNITSLVAGRDFTITGLSLSSPTGDKRILLGTSAFAALPGAPTPDFIIPAGSVPAFSTSGDTVSYFPIIPYDVWTFGTVPTDGVNSLNRDGSTGANSPTNWFGDTGSVDASGGGSVPTTSEWGLLFFVLLVLCGGTVVYARRQTRTVTS